MAKPGPKFYRENVLQKAVSIRLSAYVTNVIQSFMKNDQPNPEPLPKSPQTGTDGACDKTIAPENSVSPSDLSSKSFGDYEILEEIARGGMGVVYRARQKSLNRTVALKMILSGKFASEDNIERFHVEAQAVAQLDHESIIPIYEIDQHEGRHFFSMKLIEGGHLDDRLCELREDIPKGVEILAKVCHAVHHAHQRGILHRDLKPQNILIDQEGDPFVTDFGLARRTEDQRQLTQTGAVLGTPNFMAPEQASGTADITTAADIYSLGALLYKLISGKPPFDADSTLDTLLQVVNESPVKPSEHCKVDRCLEQICMKCLAKEPSQRYATADELASDLEKWIKGEPLSISSPSVASVTRVWLKQNFGRVAWAFLIGPAFGIVSGLCLWYSTTHQNISDAVSTYQAMPSADSPTIWFPYDTPDELSAILMTIFAASIVFIGFITVVFVKPKNQGADLAAGAIVGLCASLAGFLCCLGSLGVLTNTANEHSTILDVVREYEPGEVNFAYSKYPELRELDKVQQVDLLLQKNAHDRMFSVPKGVWLGVIASLVVYFIPSLFEAYAAGPILRKHKTWSQSLMPYIETAFPVAILMTIFAVMFSTWLLFGAVGVLPSWSLWLLFLLIVIAVVVRRRTWHWSVRIAVQTGVAIMFAFFIRNDFLHVPSVSQNIAQIQRSERQLEKSPDDVLNRMRLSEEYLNYADVLATMNRKDQAIVNLEKAFEVIADLEDVEHFPLESNVDQDSLGFFRANMQVNKARLLYGLGDSEEALQILDEVEPQLLDVDEAVKLREQIRAKGLAPLEDPEEPPEFFK